ncbi:MAG TPA: DoxX family protein [Gemmatimonadaceae bacterium]|nr:DoxX family protein [Gemmatimonadaceae bacterium]
MGVGAVGSAADIAPGGATRTLARRTGWVLTGIAVMFLAWDMAMKLFLIPQAVDGTAQLGYPVSVIRPLGLVQLGCLILYLIPRTAPLGAVLWTGYLGGAVATHVRLENPLFSHVLFPTYVAALLWGGLWLRDARVHRLLQPEPVRSTHV